MGQRSSAPPRKTDVAVFATCFNQRLNLLQTASHTAATGVMFCYNAQVGRVFVTTSVAFCYNCFHFLLHTRLKLFPSTVEAFV